MYIHYLFMRVIHYTLIRLNLILPRHNIHVHTYAYVVYISQLHKNDKIIIEARLNHVKMTIMLIMILLSCSFKFYHTRKVINKLNLANQNFIPATITLPVHHMSTFNKN